MLASEATFSADFFTSSPFGFFISNPEGRYVFANAALAAMLGYDTPEELINSVTDIAAQAYANPDERQEFMRLMQEHGKVDDHECRFKRSSVRTAPLSGYPGALRLFLMIRGGDNPVPMRKYGHNPAQNLRVHLADEIRYLF